MTNTLVRDFDRLCSSIPDLSTLEFEGTGVWGGATVQLSQDGTWVAHWTSGRSPVADRFDEVVLKSAHGSLIITKAVVTSRHFPGPIEGMYISAKLIPAGADSGGDSSCRRANVLKLDTPFFDFLHVHGFVVDSTPMQRPSRSWLPVSTPLGDIHIYYLHTCKLLFIESERPVTEDDFDRCVFAIRLLLTYLTKAPLLGSSQWVAFADNGDLQHVEWRASGRTSPRPRMYRPIPSDWSEWGRVLDNFNLDSSETPLPSTMFSGMVQRLLDKPGTMAPIEYILAAYEQMLELRGALLSVAIESMAELLRRDGLMQSKKPLPDKVWDSVCHSLQDVVVREVASEPEAQRILVSRIKNLNSPTNKDKLLGGFMALDVQLTEDEIAAVDQRNTLLHTGRLGSKASADGWRGKYVMEMRLLTAINKLLLSYLGYSGPVIDWGAKESTTGAGSYVWVGKREARE